MPPPTRRAARADLPTAWGGEIGADSPPGALRAPTSPLRGEAKLAPTPHPASSLRELADLPAWRGGEINSPPGPLASRAGRPPHFVGRRPSAGLGRGFVRARRFRRH